MTDWRKHSWRRRSGERMGDRIYTAFLFCTIVASLLFGSWQHGRFFGEQEARFRYVDDIRKAQMDLIKFKMRHYGNNNYYIVDKQGRLRYVTDPKDIDNEKKWRETR